MSLLDDRLDAIDAQMAGLLPEEEEPGLFTKYVKRPVFSAFGKAQNLLVEPLLGETEAYKQAAAELQQATGREEGAWEALPGLGDVIVQKMSPEFRESIPGRVLEPITRLGGNIVADPSNYVGGLFIKGAAKGASKAIGKGLAVKAAEAVSALPKMAELAPEALGPGPSDLARAAVEQIASGLRHPNRIERIKATKNLIEASGDKGAATTYDLLSKVGLGTDISMMGAAAAAGSFDIATGIAGAAKKAWESFEQGEYGKAGADATSGLLMAGLGGLMVKGSLDSYEAAKIFQNHVGTKSPELATKLATEAAVASRVPFGQAPPIEGLPDLPLADLFAPRPAYRGRVGAEDLGALQEQVREAGPPPDSPLPTPLYRPEPVMPSGFRGTALSDSTVAARIAEAGERGRALALEQAQRGQPIGEPGIPLPDQFVSGKRFEPEPLTGQLPLPGIWRPPAPEPPPPARAPRRRTPKPKQGELDLGQGVPVLTKAQQQAQQVIEAMNDPDVPGLIEARARARMSNELEELARSKKTKGLAALRKLFASKDESNPEYVNWLNEHKRVAIAELQTLYKKMAKSGLNPAEQLRVAREQRLEREGLQGIDTPVTDDTTAPWDEPGVPRVEEPLSGGQADKLVPPVVAEPLTGGEPVDVGSMGAGRENPVEPPITKAAPPQAPVPAADAPTGPASDAVIEKLPPPPGPPSDAGMPITRPAVDMEAYGKRLEAFEKGLGKKKWAQKDIDDLLANPEYGPDAERIVDDLGLTWPESGPIDVSSEVIPHKHVRAVANRLLGGRRARAASIRQGLEEVGAVPPQKGKGKTRVGSSRFEINPIEPVGSRGGVEMRPAREEKPAPAPWTADEIAAMKEYEQWGIGPAGQNLLSILKQAGIRNDNAAGDILHNALIETITSKFWRDLTTKDDKVKTLKAHVETIKNRYLTQGKGKEFGRVGYKAKQRAKKAGGETTEYIPAIVRVPIEKMGVSTKRKLGEAGGRSTSKIDSQLTVEPTDIPRSESLEAALTRYTMEVEGGGLTEAGAERTRQASMEAATFANKLEWAHRQAKQKFEKGDSSIVNHLESLSDPEIRRLAAQGGRPGEKAETTRARVAALFQIYREHGEIPAKDVIDKMAAKGINLTPPRVYEYKRMLLYLLDNDQRLKLPKSAVERGFDAPASKLEERALKAEAKKRAAELKGAESILGIKSTPTVQVGVARTRGPGAAPARKGREAESGLQALYGDNGVRIDVARGDSPLNYITTREGGRVVLDVGTGEVKPNYTSVLHLVNVGGKAERTPEEIADVLRETLKGNQSVRSLSVALTQPAGSGTYWAISPAMEKALGILEREGLIHPKNTATALHGLLPTTEAIGVRRPDEKTGIRVATTPAPKPELLLAPIPEGAVEGQWPKFADWKGKVKPEHVYYKMRDFFLRRLEEHVEPELRVHLDKKQVSHIYDNLAQLRTLDLLLGGKASKVSKKAYAEEAEKIRKEVAEFYRSYREQTGKEAPGLRAVAELAQQELDEAWLRYQKVDKKQKPVARLYGVGPKPGEAGARPRIQPIELLSNLRNVSDENLAPSAVDLRLADDLDRLDAALEHEGMRSANLDGAHEPDAHLRLLKAHKPIYQALERISAEVSKALGLGTRFAGVLVSPWRHGLIVGGDDLRTGEVHLSPMGALYRAKAEGKGVDEAARKVVYDQLFHEVTHALDNTVGHGEDALPLGYADVVKKLEALFEGQGDLFGGSKTVDRWVKELADAALWKDIESTLPEYTAVVERIRSGKREAWRGAEEGVGGVRTGAAEGGAAPLPDRLPQGEAGAQAGRGARLRPGEAVPAGGRGQAGAVGETAVGGRGAGQGGDGGGAGRVAGGGEGGRRRVASYRAPVSLDEARREVDKLSSRPGNADELRQDAHNLSHALMQQLKANLHDPKVKAEWERRASAKPTGSGETWSRINAVRQLLSEDAKVAMQIYSEISQANPELRKSYLISRPYTFNDLDADMRQVLNLKSPEELIRKYEKGLKLSHAEKYALRTIAVDVQKNYDDAAARMDAATIEYDSMPAGPAKDEFKEKVQAAKDAWHEAASKMARVDATINDGTEWGRDGAYRRIVAMASDPEQQQQNALREGIREQLSGRYKNKSELTDVVNKLMSEYDRLRRQADWSTNGVKEWVGLYRKAHKFGLLDKFLQFYKAGLLGYTSRVANIGSNTIFVNGIRKLENDLAGVLEQGWAKLKGQTPEAFADEFMLSRMVSQRALKEALPVWTRSQRDAFALRPLDYTQSREFVDDLVKMPSAIGGSFGEFISFMFKGMNADDAFYKHYVKVDHYYRRIYRNVRNNVEGFVPKPGESRWEATERIVGEMTQNIHDMYDKGKKMDERFSGIHEDAQKLALKDTYQEQLPGVAKSLQQALYSGGGRVFQIPIPFVKTPFNIAKQVLERTPVIGWGIDAARWKNMSHAQKVDATSKHLLSGMIAAGLYSMIDPEKISGAGPIDPEANMLKRATGWAPYSIKIGDTWYSYSRLEPFSSLLGMLADTIEGQRQGDFDRVETGVTRVLGSVAENITNKTFLSGLENMSNAISDPIRYAEDWLKRTESSLVPNTIGFLPYGHLAQTLDPVYREVDVNPVNVIKSKTPGLSQTLAPQYSPTGEVRERPSTFGPRFLSPFVTHKEKTDPVARAARVLSDINYPMRRVRSEMDYKGIRVQLTPEEQRRLAKAQNDAMAFIGKRLINDPTFRALPDNEDMAEFPGQKTKKDVIAKIMRRYRNPVVNALNPMLRQRAAEHLRERADAGA